jgi:hypothetical protein
MNNPVASIGIDLAKRADHKAVITQNAGNIKDAKERVLLLSEVV